MTNEAIILVVIVVLWIIAFTLVMKDKMTD